MSHIPDEEIFQQFIIQRKKDLQRIAGATRKEHQLEDVINQAWVMAYELAIKEGSRWVLSDEAGQHQLLSHLYQALVRYTERNVRHAVRLNHPSKGESEGDTHPLAHMLVADDGRDVLNDLVERDAKQEREAALAAHGSRAVAYVYLLRRFDNKMSGVANHLRISRSHAYRCYADAKFMAIHMKHIPTPELERFAPGPWRSFRLRRPQAQLEFTFDDDMLI
jgi:hypothetical protein